MLRLVVVVCIVGLVSQCAGAQTPVLLTGSPNDATALSRLSELDYPKTGRGLTVALGSLKLNTNDPLAEAWLQVGKTNGSFRTLTEFLEQRESEQYLNFGSTFFFGGNVPHELIVALQSGPDAPAMPGASGGGSPFLNLAVTPPSQIETGSVAFELLGADGVTVLASQRSAITGDQWWVLGLSSLEQVVGGADGIAPIDENDHGLIEVEILQPPSIDFETPADIITTTAPPGVPEPTTLALAGLGLAACVVGRKRI